MVMVMQDGNETTRRMLYGVTYVVIFVTAK